jgi:hypothetical protein
LKSDGFLVFAGADQIVKLSGVSLSQINAADLVA